MIRERSIERETIGEDFDASAFPVPSIVQTQLIRSEIKALPITRTYVKVNDDCWLATNGSDGKDVMTDDNMNYLHAIQKVTHSWWIVIFPTNPEPLLPADSSSRIIKTDINIVRTSEFWLGNKHVVLQLAYIQDLYGTGVHLGLKISIGNTVLLLCMSHLTICAYILNMKSDKDAVIRTAISMPMCTIETRNEFIKKNKIKSLYNMIEGSLIQSLNEILPYIESVTAEEAAFIVGVWSRESTVYSLYLNWLTQRIHDDPTRTETHLSITAHDDPVYYEIGKKAGIMEYPEGGIFGMGRNVHAENDSIPSGIYENVVVVPFTIIVDIPRQKVSFINNKVSDEYTAKVETLIPSVQN